MEKISTKTAQNGQFYFNLEIGKSETILSGEVYESTSIRDNSIESVKRGTPDASVEEDWNLPQRLPF